MTAFGNGQVWAVIWEGDCADTVRRDLIDLGNRAIVQCGMVGAIWRVMGWQELSGERVGATLAPVAPHSISPAARIPGLPIPQGAN